MKNFLKKLTSLFFLLLGIAPLLLVIFIAAKKQQIRFRMEEEMEHSQSLQTIILPENKVVWMDKHEIWVNNSMFDIHSTNLENGIYTFTGLYDEEETEWVVEERQATERSKEQHKLLIHFFKNLPGFHHPQTDIISSGAPCTQYPILPLRDFSDPFREIITPPPQARLHIAFA